MTGYWLAAVAIIAEAVVLLAWIAMIERRRVTPAPAPRPLLHHLDPSDPDTKIEWPQREEA